MIFYVLIHELLILELKGKIEVETGGERIAPSVLVKDRTVVGPAGHV